MDKEKKEQTKNETGGGTDFALTAPFPFEGENFTELRFDFEKLTGRDSLAVEAELASMGKTALIPEVSADYLIRIAARACATVRQDGRRLGSDFFMSLPLRDYARIRRMTRNFLLNSDSPSETEETGSDGNA